MGINTRSHSNKDSIFLTFVPLLGALFIDNDENRATIKAARVHADAQQKDGYQGYKGNCASAKALAYLKEQKLDSASSVSGEFRGVTYREKELSTGGTLHTVYVSLRDNGDFFTLKLDAGNTGTHKLLQKLAHVPLNMQIDIALFGSYKANPKDPDGPLYTDYAASVKTADGEVRVHDGAWNAVNDVVKSLENQLNAIQGITKDAVSTAVRTAKTKHFAEMAKAIGAVLAAGREDEKNAEGGTEGGSDDMGPNFDNDDDQIPF